ncbi:MAG: RNA pseudouridine synthase [Bacteroidales bacterium]|nr:RNA pseudouridine synthase [Bacteroidales bacterium]
MISRILHEDNHLLVFNKLPSEIVQGDKTGDVPLVDLLKDYLKRKYHKPGNVFLGVVHRLDRPASGVVLFARTSKALSRMNEMLRDGNIQKIYWAIVKNKPVPESGHLVHFLRKNEKQNRSYVFDHEVRGAKRAELNYRLLCSCEFYHLIEIELLTGRHHQIRAQLAAIGCPIRGDVKYGFPRTNEDGSIHLHARSVEFTHPVTKEAIRIEAQPPADALWDYFGGLTNDCKAAAGSRQAP